MINRIAIAFPFTAFVFTLIALVYPPVASFAKFDYYQTPTNLPETNAPQTLTPTPRVFCKVVYLVSIRQGVAVNVRPTPSRNTTPTTTIDGTQNPYSAVWTDGNWFELCSINRQYITGDPQYVTFVTVTPLPPTPTRIAVTSTPVATSTPTPSYTWMAIDTEGDGVLTLIRCLNPCKIVYSNREPTP